MKVHRRPVTTAPLSMATFLLAPIASLHLTMASYGKIKFLREHNARSRAPGGVSTVLNTSKKSKRHVLKLLRLRLRFVSAFVEECSPERETHEVERESVREPGDDGDGLN